MKSPDRLLLTRQEVADVLGIAYMTVCKLAADGDLTEVAIGRARKITARSFDAYLERNGIVPASRVVPFRTRAGA